MTKNAAREARLAIFADRAAEHGKVLVCWRDGCGLEAQPGRPLHWVGVGEADPREPNWAHRHCPKR